MYSRYGGAGQWCHRVRWKPVNKEVSYRKHIGYMPQIGRYPENMRVRQVVNMMTDLYPNGADMDTELAEDILPAGNGSEIHAYPVRWIQTKVSAVLAFLFDVPVLILDEPTAGLDPSAEVLRQKYFVKGKKVSSSSFRHMCSANWKVLRQTSYI